MISPQISEADDRCEKTDLIKTQCAHCRGDRSIEEQVHLDLEVEYLLFMRTHRGWFAARYPGRCHCGKAFAVGVPVRMNPGLGWRAYCCRERP